MLKINEEFEIREDDELNYGLYELKEVTNKQTKEKRKEWRHIGYFGKVSHALMAALNKYIKETIGQEALDCRSLLDRLEKIEKDLYWVDVKYEAKIKPFAGVNVKGGMNGKKGQAIGGDVDGKSE